MATEAAQARSDPSRSARLRIAVVAALSLAQALGATASAASAECKARLLRELGWRFVASDAARVDIQAGAPCDRADLNAARAAGDLRVETPVRLDAGARERLYDRLLKHPATACAYDFQLGAATRRAVDRLVSNRGFRFSAVQLGWIGFGASGAARDGWRPISWFGRGYRPSGANSRAIEGFYRGQVRGECGLGRQIAQYAAQAELYGMAGFDAEFDADEIVIGTFNRLHSTRSILLGSSAGRFVHDGRAVAAAREGRQAFMGRPGFVFHVFDRSSLDDINNQAENFVVYDVSAQAATALRRHRGFEFYNERNREIWRLARALQPYRSKRFFERLLHERDPALRAGLPASAQATLERLDAELADPFYRGFEIYVHKQGVKPVGFHIVRLLDRNPRTPFRIELALHNLRTTLFERYLGYRLRQCAAADRDAG
jgi:hypothetical protein